MSDGLIEKIAQEIWDESETDGGHWLWSATDDKTKDNFRRAVRLGLAILAKPENVSDEMRDEACQAIFGFKPGNYDHQERVRKAIAASIQSILKTGQEKGPHA